MKNENEGNEQNEQIINWSTWHQSETKKLNLFLFRVVIGLLVEPKRNEDSRRN